MLRCSPVRAGWILKEGGWGARERDFQRLLKPASFGTFLAGARKVHSPPYEKAYTIATPTRRGIFPAPYAHILTILNTGGAIWIILS